MRVLSNRFRFTTIGIVSGNPKFDAQTAVLIDKIQKQSSEPVNFIGVIGDEFASKLQTRYGSTSVLDHHENVITRNYDEDANESIFNPFRASTHYRNFKLLKSLKANGFFEELVRKNAPAVIGVGNFSLARRLHDIAAQVAPLLFRTLMKPELTDHLDWLLTWTSCTGDPTVKMRWISSITICPDCP